MSGVREVVIGFLGCGNIGGGVWRLLEREGEALEKREGIRFQVKRILVRNRSKLRGTVPEEILTDNADDVLRDPDIQIVAEFMGGAEPAGSYIERALKAGKAVVTANKNALACAWTRINEAATQTGAGLYCEASVGGGIPIIRAIGSSLQANEFSRVMGIINGTTNYMLTEMSLRGMDYAPALAEAQRLGLAEPDPTADVSGMDAVYKLSILATLAFRTYVPYQNIYHEGITQITAADMECGRRMGYTVKLLAIAKRTPDGIEARVHPAFIPTRHALASVGGSYNAILLTGDAVDDMLFYGRGAGDMPTASAVVSDLVNAAHELGKEHAALYNDTGEKINNDFSARCFVRLKSAFHGDAVGAIINVLSDHGIGVSALNQVNIEGEKSIAVVTNEVRQSAMRAALESIPYSIAKVLSVIRIEELE